MNGTVADAAWSSPSAFFDLPLPARMAVAMPDSGCPYGYSPLSGESLARSLGEVTPADLKESFNASPPARPADGVPGAGEATGAGPASSWRAH